MTGKADEVGTIIARHPVINMIAQKYPGKSKHANDSYALREQWFKSCLSKISSMTPIPKVVSLPWGIGCGAAGGDWARYRRIIDAWAALQPFEVRICMKPNN